MLVIPKVKKNIYEQKRIHSKITIGISYDKLDAIVRL